MHAGVGAATVSTEPRLFSANDYFSLHTPSTPSFQDPVAIVNDADPDDENTTAISNDGTIVSQISKKESNSPSIDDSDHMVHPNFKRESSSSNSDSKRSLTPKVLSKSATPVPPKKGGAPVQLIGDLPRAEKAAFATFEQLETNWHQYKTLGRSKVQEDAMSCECQFKPGILAFLSDLSPYGTLSLVLGVDDSDRACGANSDCINRLTQVECIEGECRCRQYCQNQRSALVSPRRSRFVVERLAVPDSKSDNTLIFTSYKRRRRDLVSELARISSGSPVIIVSCLSSLLLIRVQR